MGPGEPGWGAGSRAGGCGRAGGGVSPSRGTRQAGARPREGSEVLTRQTRGQRHLGNTRWKLGWRVWKAIGGS